jgi:glycosyltransferase involved in cell wall biosynthesis
MPKVSVIIATHSRPHLLVRAVESAFKAGKEVEVIVVDDASKDETMEVCKKLEGIKYVRVERNQRTAGARNIGILASKGDYIAFLDDDDIRLPNSLDKQIKILENNSAVGLVYGKMWLGDQDCKSTNVSLPDKIVQGDIFWQLLEGNIIPCLTAVFRKECLYKVGLLDQSLYGVDDYDLWIRIAELYEVKAVNEPVAIWRQSLPDSGQGSSNRIQEALLVKKVVEKNLTLPTVLNNPERQKNLIAILNNITSDKMIWGVMDLIKSGKSKAAVGSFLQATKLNPYRSMSFNTLKLLFSAFHERYK